MTPFLQSLIRNYLLIQLALLRLQTLVEGMQRCRASRVRSTLPGVRRRGPLGTVRLLADGHVALPLCRRGAVLLLLLLQGLQHKTAIEFADPILSAAVVGVLSIRALKSNDKKTCSATRASSSSSWTSCSLNTAASPSSPARLYRNRGCFHWCHPTVDCKTRQPVTHLTLPLFSCAYMEIRLYLWQEGTSETQPQRGPGPMTQRIPWHPADAAATPLAQLSAPSRLQPASHARQKWPVST